MEDDRIRWSDTSWVEGSPTLSVIRRIFTPTEDEFYRPIPQVLHVVDYHLWGLDPTGFHATNISLHIIAVLLAYLVGLELFRDAFAPLVTALVFATHPVHTEAVTFIAGRTDGAMGLFFFLSFFLYIRFRRSAGQPNYVLYAGAVFSFVLALMSKEAAIALPLILVLYEIYFRRLHTGESVWRKLAYSCGPAISLGVLYLLIRFPSAAWRFLIASRIGLGRQALTAVRAFYRYWDSLLLPTDLCLAPEFPWSRSFSQPDALFPLIAFTLFVAAIFLAYRFSRILSFGLAWILVSILPISNLLSISRGPLMAERYLYVPSMGFCLVIGSVIHSICNLPPVVPRARLYRTVGLAASVALLVAYSFLTVRRNQDWSSQYVLAATTVEQSPQSPEPHIVLGETYFDKEMYDEAVREFNEALTLHPRSPGAYHNLGIAYARKGEYENAIRVIKEAVAQRPGSALFRSNLALIYCELGRLDEAIEEYQNALGIDPNYVPAHISLGSAYLRKGRQDKAIDEWQKALEINPTLAKPHRNLGAVYLRKGRLNEAVIELQKALEIDPDYVDAHVNLGYAFLKTGRVDEAIRELRKALEIDPSSARGHTNLGNAYLKKGRPDDAIEEYQKALAIDPYYAEPHHNLSAAYYQKGDYELAVLHCDKAAELGGRVNPRLLQLLKEYR